MAMVDVRALDHFIVTGEDFTVHKIVNGKSTQLALIVPHAIHGESGGKGAITPRPPTTKQH